MKNEEKPNSGVLAPYSREELDIIRNHVASPDFTDSELAYCLSVSRARGLDPLQKQVYFSKRKKKDAWTVMVEPTIDGFRSMAERTGELDGYEGPFWCGEDGVWKDAWLTSDPPVAAKIVVHRKGKAFGFSATARYDAYVQGYDGKPNPIWAKMGDNQLAKCAESLALRKAFPSDLGAFYTREEMGQAEEKDRFQGLPSEPAAHHAPESTLSILPPASENPDTIPIQLCRGVFKILSEFEGIKLSELSKEDLELVISTVSTNALKVRDENAKKWLINIKSKSENLYRDIMMDTDPKLLAAVNMVKNKVGSL